MPAPGVELKLAPVGDQLEARLRGPNITPGYWRDAELTRAAFDEEGYYSSATRSASSIRAIPSQGFTFEGRLAEDFKLSTGTWVRVGPLRAALLAHFGDLVQDVVIAGHDRDERRGAGLSEPRDVPRACAGASPDVAACDVLTHPRPRAFRMRPDVVRRVRTRRSTRVARAILLDEPPSIDAQEITDKGSVNQKAVLRHRCRAGRAAVRRGRHRGPLIDVIRTERCIQ